MRLYALIYILAVIRSEITLDSNLCEWGIEWQVLKCTGYTLYPTYMDYT